MPQSFEASDYSPVMSHFPAPGECATTNANFHVMYRHEKGAMLALGKTDQAAVVLMEFLLYHMDTENSLIVSGETMAEALCWSLSKVRSKIRTLYNARFIDILKSGNTNIYVVNANIAWCTYANRRQYAKFRTNVLISKSEQELHRQIRRQRTPRILLNPERS